MSAALHFSGSMQGGLIYMQNLPQLIRWQSILRKTGRIFAIILGTILLLLLIFWVAIQQPAVQKRIADKATEYLSRRLQTPFSIQNIELKFFNRVLMEGVYLEDLR